MPARRAASLLLAAALAVPAAGRAAPTAPGGAPAVASLPPLVPLGPIPPEASGASGTLDPEAATRAYLATMSAADRARSDAYFEGGYWLDLWSFLWSAAVMILLLATGASARMRDRAERRFRRRPLQVFAYAVQFIVAVAVLFFPFAVYRDFVREHRYGLSNLSFGAWLGELGKILALNVVLGGIVLVVLYAVVRRLGRRWWMWGTVLAVLFLMLTSLIAPVFIVPMFNDPRKLSDPRVTQPILSLARASGISVGDVWEVDASKQSKRVSANVSGLLGTERITLNDNLLRRASLPEIEAVMGHEMGHYVLNHVYVLLLEMGLVVGMGFAVVSALFDRLARRHPRWGVRDIADPAGLPLAALLLGAYLFVLTPVTSSIVRTSELEADFYGLQAAAQPDGEAQVVLKLGEYRKMSPGRLEEIVFYDHPSGRTRILNAMRWKAEHPETWTRAAAGGAGPGPAAR